VAIAGRRQDTGGMDTEDPHESIESSAIADADGDRLGIKHLLIWTALCGLCLASNRWLDPTGDGFGGDQRVRVSAVLRCLSEGATLGFPLAWWANRRNGRSFPRHPGDWLWLLAFLDLVVWLGVFVTSYVVGPRIRDDGLDLLVITIQVRACMALLIDIVGIMCVRRPLRWCAYMWLRLLPSTLWAVVIVGIGWWGMEYAWSVAFVDGLSYALPVIALFLGLWDWRVKAHFTWTHWVGVGIIVWALPIRIAIELTKAWASGGG
jgi:hypothetical protein